MKESMITASFKEEIRSRVVSSLNAAEYESFKLALVVVPSELMNRLMVELKADGVEFINLSKLLSRKLVSLSVKERIRRVEQELSDISSCCSESTWLSKLDILFEPSLENDPLMLLKLISKSHPIVAIWPGEVSEKSVVYSRPGKPDYKSYSLNELNDIQVIYACNGVMK